MFDLDLINLKHLLDQNQSQVLTLYLQVDASLRENQATTPAWYIWAKNALLAVNQSVPTDKRDPWNRIQRRAVDFLESYIVEEKGIVLFIGEDFTYGYHLPVIPHDNLVRFGEPLVSPLIWLMDEYERYLVVIVDQEEAHFLTTYLGNIGREEAMASERFSFDSRLKTTRSGERGSGKDKLSGAEAELVTQFHRDVAARIEDLMSAVNAQRVIIGGNEQAAQEVRRYLPKDIAIAGILTMPFDETDTEVMARILPVSLAFERAHELETVRFVISQARSRGQGVLGMEAVQEALKLRRVETLIASWPPKNQEQLHHLTISAMREGSRIELVFGEAAEQLNEVGEVAALLRYTL